MASLAPRPAALSGLTDLPPELLLRIVSAVIPEGLESLALSCKDIHQLCKPFLEHHNLLRAQFHRFEYQLRSTRVLQDPLWRPLRNAFDLLERIAAEPVVARYIQHADLCWDSYPSTYSLPPEVPEQDIGGPVVELFANSPYLRRAGLDWWDYYSRVAEGYDRSRPIRFSQHAAVFFLTLLPNAKSLLLPRYWQPTEEIDKLTSVIVARRGSAARCSQVLVWPILLDWILTWPRDTEIPSILLGFGPFLPSQNCAISTVPAP